MIEIIDGEVWLDGKKVMVVDQTEMLGIEAYVKCLLMARALKDIQ